MRTKYLRILALCLAVLFALMPTSFGWPCRIINYSDYFWFHTAAAEALASMVYSREIIRQGEDRVRVQRVIDGDTFVTSTGQKVRLIGVDTPETRHPKKPVQTFGKEASEFTRGMIEGKAVFLAYDWQKNDRYGRLLAYVYTTDGTFLNAEIINHGYGFAYTRYPFKFLDEFRRYEKEAMKKGSGLWNVR